MAVFYFALCIVCLHSTTVIGGGIQRNEIYSNFGVQKENSTMSLEQAKIISKREVCDCGPNSKSCNIVEGEKVCKCKFRYRQVDGFCQPYCEKRSMCDNGARCKDESCRCLPGTSGDFCQIVDECEGEKGPLKCGDPEKINCRYDTETQKAICNCRIFEYEYDESTRRCVECDCNRHHGSCHLVDGKKTCKCNPGAAVRQESRDPGHFRCAPCDCGNNSNGCSFEDQYGYGNYWSETCDCKEGYFELDSSPKSCAKCECGPHGKCYSKGFYMGCNCDDGYKAFLTNDKESVFCKECDCGGNGVCSFEKEEKKCKCDKYFAERDGKCVACQCYANDKTVECFFEGKTQHCVCPEGYENGTFFCKDINECSDPNICPEDTECVNTPGSYECPCIKGYEPRHESGSKTYGCMDIDECENEDLCPPVNTYCHNSLGSYKCECERGYDPVTGESAVIAGCQERLMAPTPSPKNTGVIVVGVVFGLGIAALAIGILIKRRSNRHRQLPTTDTALESLK